MAASSGGHTRFNSHTRFSVSNDYVDLTDMPPENGPRASSNFLSAGPSSKKSFGATAYNVAPKKVKIQEK